MASHQFSALRRPRLKPRLSHWTLGLGKKRKNEGVEYLVIAFFFGLGTALIGKSKGSSFFIWFLIGMVVPPLGLIAVILYRVDKDEPERECPRCHKPLKLYVQVCPRCGTDLYLPDPAAVRHPGVR